MKATQGKAPLHHLLLPQKAVILIKKTKNKPDSRVLLASILNYALFLVWSQLT